MFVCLFLCSFTRLKLRPHILTNEDQTPNFIGKKCIGVSVSFFSTYKVSMIHLSCLFLRSQHFFFINTSITTGRQAHFIYTKSPKYGTLYYKIKVNSMTVLYSIFSKVLRKLILNQARQSSIFPQKNQFSITRDIEQIHTSVNGAYLCICMANTLFLIATPSYERTVLIKLQKYTVHVKICNKYTLWLLLTFNMNRIEAHMLHKKIGH